MKGRMDCGARMRWIAPALLALAYASGAAEYEVVKDESVFAVVTHKGGLAARLAHNHLVQAGQYDVEFSMDADNPATAAFSLSFAVKDLLVDVPEAQEKWFPGIRRMGILDTPFAALSEADRKTIADHMLDKGQLDADQFPEIGVKLVSVREQSQRKGDTEFGWAATIALTVHGKTVERECPASLTHQDGRVTVEAVGAFKFTEFGIRPYSAFMGAVKNRDDFHVYAHLVANPQGGRKLND